MVASTKYQNDVQERKKLFNLIVMQLVFFCFDLGFQISNPVIKYQPDPSCMSHMEARAEMP